MGHDDHDRGQHGCDPEQEISLLETKRLAYILRDMREELTANRLEIHSMSVQIDNLTREVAETKSVQQSAIALLQGLSARIEQLKNDPVALQALADELNTNEQALAAAVSANTPAETPTEPNVPPVTEAQFAQFKRDNPHATPAQVAQFRNRPR